ADAMSTKNCSFCGKSREQVQHMIGAKKVPYASVCDECLEVCRRILEDDERHNPSRTDAAYRAKLDPLWLAERLRSSFCRRPQEYVSKLISSPEEGTPRAYICDRCVNIAHKNLSGQPDLSGFKGWLQRKLHRGHAELLHI